MKGILLFLFALVLVVIASLWGRYGGGAPYPDLVSTPGLDDGLLEEVVAYSEPIGNVAVNRDGRVFFTVHPEARPKGNKLLEHVNGASVPFPALSSQKQLFDTPLGIAIDRLDRLWVIDHGNHGMRTASIIAIDLAGGEVLRQQRFAEAIAPVGSFLQDLQISSDGRTAIIADASLFRKRPALIVYDVETGVARRVLENHSSVAAEDYIIRTALRDMTYFGGIVALRGGVDGIALGEEWLYYGALSGSGLYRIRLEDLRNESLSASQLAAEVERVSDKPLSDGLSIDTTGNVYITDVEHSAILRVDQDGRLETLIRSPQIRWPDALSFGPDDYLYVADSALPQVVLESFQNIKKQAPYQIFRFQPGATGTPGQ